MKTTTRGKRVTALAVTALALTITGGGVAVAASDSGLSPAESPRGVSSTVERAPQPGTDWQPAPSPQ